MVSALTSRHLLTKFLITDILYAKSLKKPQKKQLRSVQSKHTSTTSLLTLAGCYCIVIAVEKKQKFPLLAHVFRPLGSLVRYLMNSGGLCGHAVFVFSLKFTRR